MQQFVYDPKALSPDVNLYEIEFSQEGTEERMKEEDVLYQWANFLDEASCSQSPETKMCSIDEDSKLHKIISLEDILKFLTGSKYVPATSYKKNIG